LAPTIYPLIFGANWGEAGSYARILALNSAIAFATTPMDRSGVVVNAWLYIPFWHVLRALTTIAVVTYCNYFKTEFSVFLWLLALQMALMYVIDFCASFMFSRRRQH
jgi:hypothetical protein